MYDDYHKFVIYNNITDEEIDIVDLVSDLIKRDKLFRLRDMFNNNLTDLEIVTKCDCGKYRPVGPCSICDNDE